MNTSRDQAVIPAPFGALGVSADAGRLAGVAFLRAGSALQLPQEEPLRGFCAALSAYLADASTPLDLPLTMQGTDFQLRVWRALQEIPVGHTVTYGELAVRVGSGARAVANACGANPVPLVIPCHRVVSHDGLGGFMQGRDEASLFIKQWLLQHERGNTAAA